MLIDFSMMLNKKQIHAQQQKIILILENIRQTLKNLFKTGVLYHMQGSKICRDMLLSQEYILDILDVLDACQKINDDEKEREQKISALLKNIHHKSSQAQTLIEQSTQALNHFWALKETP